MHVMNKIVLPRKQAFAVWTPSSLAAVVPFIQTFIICLPCWYVCYLRCGSKETGQDPCTVGSGSSILVLKIVVSLPSVYARETGCKDNFSLLSVGIGPCWPPGYFRKRTEVASETEDVWLWGPSGTGVQSSGTGGSWIGVIILSMASNTLAQDNFVIAVETCKGSKLEGCNRSQHHLKEKRMVSYT